MSDVAESERVRKLLAQIKDPEIPIVDILELGIVRAVSVTGGSVKIDITPTYSGCPAMAVIESEIRALLCAEGFHKIEINTVYAPVWSTDWITPEAKRKLKEYGIAPPQDKAADPPLSINTLVSINTRPENIACPYCDSTDTSLRSRFGSTACKSLYFCNSCREPFEYFKTF